MLRVALTGGIATGKSYVLDKLYERGVPCLDADELTHAVTAAGTEATTSIAERFGREILDPSGAVDRAKLGKIVFADAAARHDLERIVHPAVYRAIEAGLRALERAGERVAVVAIPLLFETGRAADFSRVIVTACSTDRQIARLLERGLSETEARQRIAAQWRTEDKAGRADFVVWTDGTFEETDTQVTRLATLLLQATRS
jgi:dephospho-CoA kinase